MVDSYDDSCPVGTTENRLGSSLPLSVQDHVSLPPGRVALPCGPICLGVSVLTLV